MKPQAYRFLGAFWVILGIGLALVAAWVLVVSGSVTQAESQGSLFLRAGVVGAWVDILSALVLLGVGWGLFCTRRWALRLGVIACWFWVVGGFLALLGFVVLGGGSLFGEAAKTDVRFLSWMSHVSVSLVAALCLVLPALWSFYILRKPHVQRLFEIADPVPGWTDRCPPLTLAYGLFLGVLGFASFGSLYFTQGFFPLMGSLQRGTWGSVFYIFLGLLWFYMAFGVCLRRRLEWILSMGLGTLLAFSVLRTYFSVEPVELFRAMGASNLQIGFFGRLGLSDTAWLTGTTLAAYALFFTFWLWNEKNFRDTRDFIKLQESGFVLDERLQVALAVVLGVLVGAGLYAIQVHREQRARVESFNEDESRSRQEAEEATDALRAMTSVLPDCPMMFPLLDATGRVTPLGSSLSYWTMLCASAFPTPLFGLSDVGATYQAFRLFSGRPSLPQEVRDQMAVRCGGKDFGSGTLLQSGGGYNIRFKFWGTRPEKEYTIALSKGALHLAPGLMASCLLDWMGVQLAAKQRDGLAHPVFSNEDSFRRASNLEELLRTEPALVVHWDKILSGNPGDPFLNARWALIQRARGEGDVLGRLEGLLQTNALAARVIKPAYAKALAIQNRPADVLHLALQELLRDPGNAFWYRTALDALQTLKCWDEALRLAQTWSEKRPDRAEPLLKLAEIYRTWAFEALPNGLASAGASEGARLFRDRMGRGWSDLQKAARVTPTDGRVWCALLDEGRILGSGSKDMSVFFQKASAMLPDDPEPSALYLEYLRPKTADSDKVMDAFARSIRGTFPELYCRAWQEGILMQCWGQGASSDEGDCYRRMGQAVRRSPKWPLVEAAYREAIRRNPTGMEAWEGYLYWSQVVGKGEAALAYAKSLSASNGEWGALYPTLLLQSIEEAKKAEATDVERAAFENRPEIVRRKTQALEMLTALEPQNWQAWNLLAKHSAAYGRVQEAVRAFKAFGDHWNPSVWSKDECDKTFHSMSEAASHLRP